VDSEKMALAKEFSKEFLGEKFDGGGVDYREAARLYFQKAYNIDLAFFTDPYYERMVVEFWKIDPEHPLARPESFLAMYSGFDAETITIYEQTAQYTEGESDGTE
jgi:hypothetical protein